MMGSNISLRPAEARDLDRLGALKLESSLAWGDHVEVLKALPEACIVPVAHLRFITVSEKAGEIAGFVTVIADATTGRAVLEDLFVAPAAWRNGIGAQLLAEAERHAQAFGATHLWLVANARTQLFYEAHGFRFVERVDTDLGSAAALQKPLPPHPSWTDKLDIVTDDEGCYLDSAASIWAAATARRDGDSEPASLDEARPVIWAVLARSPRAFLVLAIEDGTPAGFAALAHAPEGDTAAELVYFGVAPSHWGRHVGSALLRALPSILAAKLFSMAFLNVYCDNERAVTLYESRGWVRVGSPVPHSRTKRLELRFRLDVGPG